MIPADVKCVGRIDVPSKKKIKRKKKWNKWIIYREVKKLNPIKDTSFKILFQEKKKKNLSGKFFNDKKKEAQQEERLNLVKQEERLTSLELRFFFFKELERILALFLSMTHLEQDIFWKKKIEREVKCALLDRWNLTLRYL